MTIHVHVGMHNRYESKFDCPNKCVWGCIHVCIGIILCVNIPNLYNTMYMYMYGVAMKSTCTCVGVCDILTHAV